MKKLFLILALTILISIAGCSNEEEKTKTPINVSGVKANLTEVEVVSEEPTAGGLMKVIFMDVAGDSAIIVAPNKRIMVIDSGTAKDGPYLLNYLRGLMKEINMTEIDVFVATHNEEENIGGIKYVLFNIMLWDVYDNGIETDADSYDTYYGLAKEHFFHVVKNNSWVNLDQNMSIYIYSPYGNGYNEDLNDNSLVVKVVYRGVSFLFMGDCGAECIDNIKENDLDADVIKIAQHGSVLATTKELMDLVTPEVAVISNVGYGNLPDVTLYDRLRGVDIYTTRDNGIITVTTDGIGFNVSATKIMENATINESLEI